MSSRKYILAGVASCVSFIALSASAQEGTVPDTTTPESTSEVYQPEFFDRFSPNTARDMLNEIPGFSVRRGDGGRGLGQGGTNVIINGARVSGKQTDPLDILQRTPASNVVRIEIVDAASLGIPGLNGQVANFILDNSTVSGSWEWNIRFRTGVKPDLYNGSISVSGERDIMSYTLSLENDSFKGGATGREIVLDNDSNLLEIREEDGQNYGENPSISANLTWNRENGDVGNFNAQASLFQFDGAERSDRFPQDSTEQPFVRDFLNSEDEWNTEISGDYKFDFLDGELKLIGLQYYESSPFLSLVTTRRPGEDPTGSTFERQADEGESIFRAEYSWSPKEDHSWELGVEGVFNFLEIDDVVSQLNDQGEFEVIDETISFSRVEEKRAETTIAYNRPLGDKIDLQASVGLEYSEITQESTFRRTVTDPDTGLDTVEPFDASQERSFTRPKGFISASYKKSDSMDIRLKLERGVGQLNFFSFIGSVDLQDGIDRAGNPDLVPPQFWNYEIEFEKRFENNSQFTVQFFARQFEDIVDTIPLELPGADLSDPNRERGQGPGNIEEAERYGVDIDSTIRLDDFGIKGGELDFSFFYQETKVDDPLTGVERPFSGNSEWFSFVGYRHDIPETDYAYGFFAEYFEDSPQFGLLQISQFQWSDPFIGVFVEDKDFFGMNLEVRVNNLANIGEKFDRTFFDDFRDVPGVTQTSELRERRFDQILRISLSDTF